MEDSYGIYCSNGVNIQRESSIEVFMLRIQYESATHIQQLTAIDKYSKGAFIKYLFLIWI